MKKRDVFAELDPPPFGWPRMRNRLHAQRASRAWWAVLAGALAGIVLYASTLNRVDLMPAIDEGVNARLLDRETGGEPVVLTLGEGTVVRVPSSDPKIVFYRLAVLDTSDR